MSEGAAELRIPEFKTWSLENFGQVLKVSGNLGPEIFSYRVSISKKSPFFKSVYDGVYKGKMVTVLGSEKGKHLIKRGLMVEHMAILAANDLGEIMVSKEIFQGDWGTSLTKYSKAKMDEYNQHTRNVPLPPGWRRFGDIHSHPINDVLNSITMPFEKIPKVNNIGVSWSVGDFKALIGPIKRGFTKDTVEAVITPVQLGFMVATKKTLEILKRKDIKTTNLTKTTLSDVPPYKNFEKLGIVLYAGNHRGKGKNFILQRLI